MKTTLTSPLFLQDIKVTVTSNFINLKILHESKDCSWATSQRNHVEV